MLTIILFRIYYDNALYICTYVVHAILDYVTVLSNHSIRVTHDKQSCLLYNRMFDCSIRVYQSAFGDMPVFLKVLLQNTSIMKQVQFFLLCSNFILA